MPNRSYSFHIAALVWILSILEVFLMGGPFAVYFYGAYSPFLSWTKESALFSWVTELSLTHLSLPKSAVLEFLQKSGKMLFMGGVILFVIHAVYLYWMKWVRKAVATHLLYRYIRHPQYTCFLIAAVGLAIRWPRAINFFLLGPLFLAYYALARHEEKRVSALHPEGYAAYRAKTSFFLPWKYDQKTLNIVFGWVNNTRVRVACGLVFIFLFWTTLPFMLRAWSVANLDAFVVSEMPNVLLVSWEGRKGKSWEKEVSPLLSNFKAAPSDGVLYFMQDRDRFIHALSDTGLTYEGKEQLKKISPKDAFLYLIVAKAYRSCDARACQALNNPWNATSMTAIRKFEKAYVVQKSESKIEINEVSLPEDAFFKHATVPIL